MIAWRDDTPRGGLWKMDKACAPNMYAICVHLMRHNTFGVRSLKPHMNII